MVCGYNLSQKVSGFNNAFLPICKGFKCITQFVTLFRIEAVKINKIGPAESYFSIIGANKPI